MRVRPAVAQTLTGFRKTRRSERIVEQPFARANIRDTLVANDCIARVRRGNDTQLRCAIEDERRGHSRSP
jgi:hypothetical protein